MAERQLRWGILGTATIARKNWRAISLAGNAVVTAVASRSLDRSRAYVEACQGEIPFPTAPKALGSYEELIASPEVDAVYVPLPTALRKEWVIRAAEAGKHVICEKPCGASLAELREMLTACKKSGVQFMDGVMFVHSRRFQRVQEILQAGEVVGEIRRIASQFSFRAGDEFVAGNIRADAALEPAGCLGDLGWYNLRFALMVLGGRLPTSVTGRVLSQMRHPGARDSVPSEFSGELLYPGGLTAGFYCAFVTELQQWASVSGTRGLLRLDDFVLPFAGEELSIETSRAEYSIRGCDFRMDGNVKRESVREAAHGEANAQEVNLYRAFSGTILSGRREPAWMEMVWKNQLVMEACLESSRQGGREVAVTDPGW